MASAISWLRFLVMSLRILVSSNPLCGSFRIIAKTSAFRACLSSCCMSKTPLRIRPMARAARNSIAFISSSSRSVNNRSFEATSSTARILIFSVCLSISYTREARPLIPNPLSRNRGTQCWLVSFQVLGCITHSLGTAYAPRDLGWTGIVRLRTDEGGEAQDMRLSQLNHPTAECE